MLIQQVREVMTVNQELEDESSWIWLTSEQMSFLLRNLRKKITVKPEVRNNAMTSILIKLHLSWRLSSPITFEKFFRKNLKLHNNMEGLGQLANHTCCDEHWNANLEVAAIEHEEDTNITPIAILGARRDIEKYTEILTRYWHQEKGAWRSIFECKCCACTNHTMMAMPTPT